MLHVIFTPDGIPGHISADPRPGSEPVEGLTIDFLAAHRRTATGEWVKRDPVIPPEPTAEELAARAAQALSEAREMAQLDRFDFASRAAQAGYISFIEAAAWAAGNAVPAKVQAIIDTMPAEKQGLIMLDVLARPVMRRNAELMPALAAAFGADDAALDALFGIAS